MENPKITEAVPAQPVLLSPIFHIGECVGRHFYHHFSGFGTLQSETSVCNGQVINEIRAVWPDFDYIEGMDGESGQDYWDQDLGFVHEQIRDDEIISNEIKEMINLKLNDPFLNGLRGIKMYVSGEEVDISHMLDPEFEER